MSDCGDGGRNKSWRDGRLFGESIESSASGHHKVSCADSGKGAHTEEENDLNGDGVGEGEKRVPAILPTPKRRLTACILSVCVNAILEKQFGLKLGP